jgi:transposase InsO family protein
MGAKPSSAVQQSAYLEALDDYIDYYEDGSLRSCLLDKKTGKRLKDSQGNVKTLRHRFAVYCDDIAAGSNSLEELYELFEALICACKRAGIQIKASKVKFGVEEVTFHNYTISREGTKPKDANLCPIRNMTELTDVTQVRAFLGCCQQMSDYVEKYGIIAFPLHFLTKKDVPFPRPWEKGKDYDVAFNQLKAAVLDESNFLHHKDPSKRLFIEVDASDAGWGACVYQMEDDWEGDPSLEGRGRQETMGKRMVLQWISKSWTEHELKLPVFYRESLARLLCLERFRNHIETSIAAGITLYTDHKPGLYENALSNKGQLSAWKLLVTADLLSIVENLYRQGGKMIGADPLSRVCAPTSGFYDVSLPQKIASLLDRLPDSVKNCRNLRLYANKDNASASRQVQKWRSPTNPVSQGKLTSYVVPKRPPYSEENDLQDFSIGYAVRYDDTDVTSFSIATPYADTGVTEIRKMIEQHRPFAILTPISLIPQIARNLTGNSYDAAIQKEVAAMTTIVMAATADAWLINLPNLPKTTEILSFQQVGCTDIEAQSIVENNVESFIQNFTFLDDWQEHNERSRLMRVMETETLIQTRSQMVDSSEELGSLPAKKTPSIIKKKASGGKLFPKKVKFTSPLEETPSKTNKGASKKAIPKKVKKASSKAKAGKYKFKSLTLDSPFSKWVGTQLRGQSLPEAKMKFITTSIEGHPEGLEAICSPEGGAPRIIVPLTEQSRLVNEVHKDIHHQGHKKVHHVLQPLFYWPGMDASIKSICSSCAICARATKRRKTLQSEFNAASAASELLPREGYGIDFYGIQGGEILVIVDLFTREASFTYLKDRKQEKVLSTILKKIIYSRGVPKFIRSDNAPELMQGVVRQLCEYLGITQIVTGGHNPKGNSICERVNQTLGNMIRKLNDDEYKQVQNLIPALEFAYNTTLSSVLNVSPFEVGYGGKPRTITTAKTEARLGGGGTDPDILEDVCTEFDKSITKNILELSQIMAKEARSTSEWHRRMTNEKLNQAHQRINMKDFHVGAQVYFYKPPTVQQVEKKGRKAKHIDHYVGPGTIVRMVGGRSVVISKLNATTGKNVEFQRDVGMVLPVKVHREATIPLPSEKAHKKKASSHKKGMEPLMGEILILKDDPESTDWYVAEVLRVLDDRMVVSYYTTKQAPLDDFSSASRSFRTSNLKEARFRKTWVLNFGKGVATQSPPKNTARIIKDLWTGKVSRLFWDEQLLVRNVHISSKGKLDDVTISILSKLRIPHHLGA